MVKNTSLKEFLPDRPVMFDPPKLMYVWNGFDDIDSPTLADVAYVNPFLSVNRVLALGMNVSARNMGTTWNHCAECCTTLGNHERDALVQDSACKEESPERSEPDQLPTEIVTHRELARWVSDGNGQVILFRMNDRIETPHWSTSFSYCPGLDKMAVPTEGKVGVGEIYVKVRRYGDDNAADPTREYLGLVDTEHIEYATYCNVVRWLSDELCMKHNATVTYGSNECIISRNRAVITLLPGAVELDKYAGDNTELPGSLYRIDEHLEGTILYDPEMRMEDYVRVMVGKAAYVDYIVDILERHGNAKQTGWISYTEGRTDGK